MTFLLRPRAWWIACLLVAVLHVATVPAQWQVEGVDEIEYLSLAHSLTLGQGYTMYGEPHVKYPPLPALVFAGVMRVAGEDNWRALYGFNALLGVGALAGFGAWLRRRFGGFGIWASWLSLVSYYAWSFGTRFLLSEPLYLVLSLAAIALAHDLLEHPAPSRRRWLALAGVCLLAAMTRSASVALAAALMLSGGIHFLRHRGARGLLLAAVAGVAMLGFNALWQVRAVRVEPQASESYLKWARRLLAGSAGESSAADADLVARNKGEGISPEQNRWPIRTLLLTERLGQVLTGVPRPPAGFLPLAAFLALLVAAGVAADLRARPHSAAAWLVLLSLALFSLTSWVSSYLRYLYALLPLLLLFLLRGARVAVAERVRRPAGVLLLGFGAWCLVASFLALLRPGPLDGGAEQLYQLAVSALGLMTGAILLVLGVVWFRRVFRPDPSAPPPAFLAVALLLVGLHTALLVFQRVRLTRQNAAHAAMELDHAIDCARWVRANTAKDARGICAYPMLMRLFCGRELRPPSDCRDPFRDQPDFVLNIGILSHVPGVPWQEAECLRRALVEAERLEGRKPALRSGYASVVVRAPAALEP